MSVTFTDVRGAIKSFSPGLAGVRDGLRPKHLKEMTENQGGVTLCEALRDFSNLVLAGKIPETVRPVFFGATLFPFIKKDGGIRFIAVGLTLRRLVAKMANRLAQATCGPILQPTQLGV